MTDESEARDPIEQLLGRALAKAEAPPRQTVEAAKALADFIDLDASLARLLDAEQPALRDPRVSQDVYQWDDGTTLHLQTAPSGNGLQITGLLEGQQVDAMTMQSLDGTIIPIPLVHGSFETLTPDGQWFRVLFTSGGQDYMTPWERTRTDG